jgi:hypothetical protein
VLDLLTNWLTVLGKLDLTLFIIVALSLSGSYGKDYLRILRSPTPSRISISNILLSTITASICTYGLSDIIVTNIGPKALLVISFIMGLIGFQLLEKLSTIEGVLGLAKDIKALDGNSGSQSNRERRNSNGGSP